MAAITRTQAEDFLYLEAQLLDERRFEEWLDLFAREPGNVAVSKSRPEICCGGLVRRGFGWRRQRIVLLRQRATSLFALSG